MQNKPNFKDLTIFIPTLGRSEIQNTYHNLSPELQAITKLVIHESEKDVKAYKNYEHIVCPLYPIAEKRAWIIKNCKTKYLVMLDDDLVFSTRKEKGNWQLRAVDANDMNNMFEDILGALKYGYAQVGISPRPGNNRVEEEVVENTRMYAVLGFNAKVVVENVEFCRVQFQEDFDIILQLLRKGFPNCVFYKWTHGPALGFHEKGGCSNERTLELQNASVRKLASLHPGFVTIRKMNKKYDNEFAQRDEVICYWKKAFASSQLKKKK